MVLRAISSARAGVRAAREAWSDPQGNYNWEASDRAAFYDLQWDYFSNLVWERLADWATDVKVYRRYPNIKSLYNPVFRTARFYMQEVYPGVLDLPGITLPKGVPSAIPLAQDTDDDMKAAIGQLWQWSNWQVGKDTVVLYDSVLGNCLVEILDQRDRGKVTWDIWWPGHVKDLEVDRGDVKMFHVEKLVQERDAQGKYTGKSYRWGKRVDRERITYYRDGDPYNYGPGAVLDNVYGFVPACWFRFYDFGELFGQPAIFGSLNKVDRLNDLASMLHDQIAKIVRSPVILAGGSPTPGSAASTAKKLEEANTTELARRRATAETGDTGGQIEVVTLPQGSSAISLPINEANIIAAMEHQLAEIEKDHPEMVTYQMLRERNISGVAAREMLGDVNGMLLGVSAGHDMQMVKLHQMSLAIAGENIRTGVWTNLTSQQALFGPYSLSSYAAGDLDHSIVPRQLFEETETERWTAKEIKYRALISKLDLKIPVEQLQKELEEYDEDELEAFAEAAAADAAAFGAALLGAGVQNGGFNSGAGVTPQGAGAAGAGGAGGAGGAQAAPGTQPTGTVRPPTGNGAGQGAAG